MVEEVRSVDKGAALANDGIFDRRMTIAKRIDADAAEKIEIAIPLLVDYMYTLAAHEEERIPLVGGKQQPRFCCTNLVEFCHFSFSSGHHHFGAMGYARVAKIGKGISRFGWKYSYALYAVQKCFTAGAELG